MYRIVLVSFLAFAASTAHANIDSSSKKAAGKQAVDVTLSFEDQKRAIEADLADGETYSEIAANDRETVTGALQRISSALAKAGGAAGLSETDKAAVINDQELVNTILTRSGDDSRLVCVREKKVGSNRTTTQCSTVGQRRRVAEETRQALQDGQRVLLRPTN